MKISDIVQFKDGHKFMGICFDGRDFEVIYKKGKLVGVKAVEDFTMPYATDWPPFMLAVRDAINGQNL